MPVSYESGWATLSQYVTVACVFLVIVERIVYSLVASQSRPRLLGVRKPYERNRFVDFIQFHIAE